MKFERMGPCDGCMWRWNIRGPHSRTAVIRVIVWFMIATISAGFFVACLSDRGEVWSARWGWPVEVAFWVSFVMWLGAVIEQRKIFSILRSNFIGWTYFLFFDRWGKFHVHRGRPNPISGGAFIWIPGAIFQVRSGGWFRRNRILHQGDKIWKIVHAWDGLEDIRIHDGFFCELSYEEPEFLVEVVNRFHWMSGVIDHLVACERIADHLGITNARLIERIKCERATMGRSEHARAARETLEAAFTEDLPELKQLAQRWMETAKAESATSASAAS